MSRIDPRPLPPALRATLLPLPSPSLSICPFCFIFLFFVSKYAPRAMEFYPAGFLVVCVPFASSFFSSAQLPNW
jgi:hypothetical protein